MDIAKLYQKLIPHPNPVSDDEKSDSNSWMISKTDHISIDMCMIIEKKSELVFS